MYRRLLLLLPLFAGAPVAASGQVTNPCPAGGVIDAGWTAYRGGDMATARARFNEALARCPDDPGVLSGLGYVALRENRLDDARARFTHAARVSPDNIDALIGTGLVAWREGRVPEAYNAFRRVAQLDPENETARDYLARIPEGFGTAPERSPLVRPDTVVFPSRATAGRFEIRTRTGWQAFHVNGVNLGAAVPGKHPSEFPDSSTYARWLDQMREMGANTVRVYTIHPPAFYEALLQHNRAHPESPLWVVHGVWAELPPEDDFSDPEWEGEFFQEMRYIVDLLHGRADIVPRPGHASGHYTADVSQWVLAWIIGREWEPFAVTAYNEKRPTERSFDGEYLKLARGTPMDVWLAKSCEYLISYEMQKYNAQRPIAYTNWPTTDPLTHPTETTVVEELAIRTRLGEVVTVRPREYDNDSAPLDATLVRPTSKLPAGYFASFHAYPYYPDFMILQPSYNAAASSFGRSNYFGYLEELKRYHGEMPVLISEYGVPASIGIAHLQPQGWHHGGMTEAQMAEIDARMTREIAESGMAGGIIFAWIDEWFKKNWIAIEFEIPLERNRLWYNRLDAEQHYGMIAYDAFAPVAGETLAERLTAWRARTPLYRLPGGGAVRAASDEAYLWLHYDAGSQPLPDSVFFGLDMLSPELGERSWPGDTRMRIPTGIEFSLRVDARNAQLMVQKGYNPFRVLEVTLNQARAPQSQRITEDRPPGMREGRFEMRLGRPFKPLAAGSGWEHLLVVPNRRRFGRDGTEFAAALYDRGILREGNAPDGLWQRDAERRVIEVRIPWAMLNVTDPSQRRVLLDEGRWFSAELGTTTITDIGITGASVSGGQWQDWSGGAGVQRYSWPTWEEPRSRARVRPAFDAMRTAFRDAARIAATRK